MGIERGFKIWDENIIFFGSRRKNYERACRTANWKIPFGFSMPLPVRKSLLLKKSSFYRSSRRNLGIFTPILLKSDARIGVGKKRANQGSAARTPSGSRFPISRTIHKVINTKRVDKVYKYAANVRTLPKWNDSKCTGAKSTDFSIF